MNLTFRSSLMLGVGLMAAGVALAPREAHACSVIPCDRVVELELAFPGPVPFGDGAIALKTSYGEPFGGFNESVAERVTITVTPSEGGEAVPGELVGIQAVRLLVWRPTAPLDPLTEYTVHAVVDNSLADYAECGPETLERMFTVSTSDVESIALEVPAVTPAEELAISPIFRLDSMVCCDDTFPASNGDSCGPSVTWGDGTCSAGLGKGKVAATLTLDAAAVAAGAGQIAYQFGYLAFAPGAEPLSFEFEEPTCESVTATHLKTGETMAGPKVCVGEALADMLGEQAIDPAPGLAMCAGQPYTCEVIEGPNGEQWDPMNCKTWPEGQATTGAEPTSSDSDGGSSDGSGSSGGGSSDTSDGASAGGDEPGEKGCACAANSGASDVSWAALGLLSLMWRRRRSSAPTA